MTIPSLARLVLLLAAATGLASANASVGLNLYSDDNCQNQFAAVTGDGGVCNNHSPGWSSAMANAISDDATHGYGINFYGHDSCVTGAGTHAFCGPGSPGDYPCLVMGFPANSYSFEPDPSCNTG